MTVQMNAEDVFRECAIVAAGDAEASRRRVDEMTDEAIDAVVRSVDNIGVDVGDITAAVEAVMIAVNGRNKVVAKAALRLALQIISAKPEK